MKTTQLAAAISAYILASTFLVRAQSGTLDITFNPGCGPNNGTITGVALQPDGKMVLVGEFMRWNGIPCNQVARLNTDGSLDTSFDFGDGANQSVQTVAVQSDGKVIVAGAMTSLDGVRCRGIARLRPDGSLDTSFSFAPEICGFDYISSLILQTNGQLLVAGAFTVSMNGTACCGPVRLNSDGSMDSTFNPGSGIAPNAIALQPDGKVLVGGYFTSFNSTNCYGIVRLNSDGGLDTNFTFTPMIFEYPGVSCIAVQPNGQILIGGGIMYVNGYTRHSIARLNADGSLDLSFNATAAIIFPGTVVNSLALQPDGKVIASGAFTYVNGIANVILIRLNTDGSLDTGFEPMVTNGGEVIAIALQPDGKVVIGGTFQQINGTNVNCIARLKGDTSPATSLQFLTANQYFGTYVQGGISNTYRVEWTTDLSTPSLWTPLATLTLQTNPQFILDTNPAAGRRFYRAVQLSP